jgi:penicillin-binding protein 2
MEVLTGDGELVQRIDPAPVRRLRLDDAARSAVLDGLALGAQVPPGTSSAVFASWPKARLPVRGKTGTAENPSQGGDQSWYVGYVEAGKGKSIVVAATVERGGFGAERAAPVVCQIMRSWYDAGPSACAGRATATAGVAQDG